MKSKKLKIAVNTRLLLKERMDGIGWFTYENLKRITRNNPEHQFFFIFDRPWHKDFIFSNNITPIVAGPVTRHPLLIKFWFNFRVPQILKKIDPDIFISPDGFLSHRTNYPSYTIIHDLNFEHYPKLISRSNRNLYRNNFRKFAQKAIRIGTVSEYSKNDIIATYNLNPEKIDVLYCGLNDHFNEPTGEDSKKLINKITDNRPYFLFTGTFHQRKNLARVIQSFDLFKQNTQSKTMLILAGNNKWASRETTDALKNSVYKNDIIVTGRVDTKLLCALTSNARGLVFVSLFEGFGIPVLEASASEVPVITTRNSSMEEIAGNTVLLVNPRDINEIAEAIEKIDSDENFRRNLGKDAKEKLSCYTWDNTARLLWESIMKAIDHS